MPTGISPEEKRRRQEQERRYQKAEKEARAAWQRGLENEREAAEALQEEKKTHLGKRRVSFDSSRNQTHLLYSFSPQLDPTPALTDAGNPSDELLSKRYELLVKEIASLRSGFAELEFLEIKEAEEEALARKMQAHKAAWKEQEQRRQQAEKEALEAKEAKESVLALIRREGEAASRQDEEEWKEQKRLRQMAEEKALKAEEAEKKVLARVKQEYEARKEQERCRQMEKEKLAWKRGLENERPSTSQAYPWKPEQSPYPLRPLDQEHPSIEQYPTIDHSHLKHHPRGHPSPRQAQSASSVLVGLSGLPAGSLCSDLAPNISMYEDGDRGRYVYSNTYGSTKQVPLPHDHPHSAVRQSWATPPASAWRAPTSEPEIAKPKPVIPAMCSYRGGVETPKEQWPLPPTPAHSEKETEASTPVENEKQKLERELMEIKKEYEELDRLCAELERKRRTNSASSIASWQTGYNSIREDPTKAPSKDVATGRQPETRQSRWKRGTERSNQESSIDHNDRSLSRTTTYTRFSEAQGYDLSDEERKPKLSKAHARAKLLKLELSVGMNPSYVPPTPYWHPSPSPSPSLTPPKHSDAPGPAVPGLSTSASTKASNDHWGDHKTPMPPGNWRKDSFENLRGHLKN
ncbi:uncharacterized protein B0T23DRAFT_122200 [Neurospora hispaniola]|uniref:Uncharacterized protein n=1 Tax=Neurospora hispaniola TaxID=588809 RepID=A0AAJ0IAF4_9PEZI|nr:hypothetical protein B0T23DRAFT_122200 [Neurospora hispaniola]